MTVATVTITAIWIVIAVVAVKMLIDRNQPPIVPTGRV